MTFPELIAELQQWQAGYAEEAAAAYEEVALAEEQLRKLRLRHAHYFNLARDYDHFIKQASAKLAYGNSEPPVVPEHQGGPIMV